MSTSQQEPTFFLGNGQSISKQEFLHNIQKTEAQVVCVGENHDDNRAHTLELEILSSLHTQCPSLALSLEFYHREAQTVLNEYLAGLVPLETFLSDSNPPSNHADYQPLLDYCRLNKLPAIAANCPRRYSRIVAKHGKEFLLANIDKSLAGRLLPPLPYAGASNAYRDNFLSIMGMMGNTGANVATSMLDAQSLWDATMAHSIATGLERVDKIFHVTGYFHIQHRLGMVEQLANYAPNTHILTVVILPSDNVTTLNDEQEGIGDLVVLTDINAL